VVRRPSSIYWFGMRAFGFFSPKELSLAEFGIRLADKRYHLKALLEARGDEAGDDSDAQAENGKTRISAPEVADDYWDTLGIELTQPEAEFLRHHISVNQPDSMLGQVLLDDARINQVLKLNEDAGFDHFADLPFIRDLKNKELHLTVLHARDFWRILEGAHIRYNCLLQDAGFGTEELQEKLEDQWQDWKSRLQEFPKDWNSDFLWKLVSQQGSQVKSSTQQFIHGWIEETRKGCPNLERCNELVRNQELRNKGKRARLRSGNTESISSWVGLKSAGYRLDEFRILIRDIQDGEGGAHA
jgi:hypothetical protein